MEANHTGGNASIHTTCECSDRYIALIIADSGISIHAAREGGDDAAAVSDKAMTHFNPRRP